MISHVFGCGSHLRIELLAQQRINYTPYNKVLDHFYKSHDTRQKKILSAAKVLWELVSYNVKVALCSWCQEKERRTKKLL